MSWSKAGFKSAKVAFSSFIAGLFVSFFFLVGSSFSSQRIEPKHHQIDSEAGNPYNNPWLTGPKNPINWGGLDTNNDGFITRDELEKHNVVIRLTNSGLREIGNLISDILSGDPSVANLINFLAMKFLDRCTDTEVIADLWDDEFEFLQWLADNYPNDPTRAYYMLNATKSCAIFSSSPDFQYGEGATWCFGNDIYFEYIAGYNPTGTWDEAGGYCKDTGDGLAKLCLPIPLINDEGAPICVNVVIWGQERNKQVGTFSNPIKFLSKGFHWAPFGKCGKDAGSSFCPNSLGWDNYWFLDRITGNRLIVDYNRQDLSVTLRPNIGEDIDATAICEGDLTEHTNDDYLEIGIELKNFEVALTFTSPFVDSNTRFVDCDFGGGTCDFRSGITTFPDELSYCFKNRRALDDRHICDPDFDLDDENYQYKPEKVISNYINGRVYLRIPILALRLGIQIKGNFRDYTSYQDWEHAIRGLGINLKGIDVVAGLQYDMIPMADSLTTPACHDTAWNQVGSVQYCPEYRVSQKFAKTLLWLDAVLRYLAADIFDASCISGKTGPAAGQYDTCVAYYLFPGQVFDLKSIIESLTPINHPLEEVVYVGNPTYYELEANKIFLDFGFTNDFWADSAGILLAMNVGFDVRYALWNSAATHISDVKTPTFTDYVTSCVQFASGVEPATSQIIPIPECQPQPNPPCPTSPRTVDSCTIVNSGAYPYVLSSELLPQYPASPTLAEGRYGYSLTNYYIGVALHHNLISRILYEVIGDGLACIWVDKYTPQIGGLVGGFLNTDAFGFFMPQLKERYPGKEMALEIIPIYKDPGNPAGNTGGAASYNTPLSVVAYAKTGGPTFRPVMSVYSQTSTRADFWDEFLQNATFQSGFTMFVNPSTWFDTADLMIDLPYIDLSFNVITTGDITDALSSQQWYRVFGLTIGIKVSLDLDIVPCVNPDCSLTPEFPGYGSVDFSQPLTSIYRDYYNGTAYNKDNAYFPNGNTFARVVDVTLYIDPDVRYFIAYNTNALGLSGSDWAEILGNIIPVLLSGVAGAKLRVAFDPSALIQIPIELNFPWVGPEFGSLNWDQPFPASGGSADQIGDYFEMFIHWKGRTGMSNIIKLLKNFGVDIVDMIGGVAGLAPRAVNFATFNTNGNGIHNNGIARINPPETFITYTSDPHALYTRVEFSGWSPEGGKLKYSWRLDGGTWNLWQEENSVVLHHLLEGWHVFEVRAKDERKFIDPTPARFVFRIDSLGPDINVVGADTVRGEHARFKLSVRDAQAEPEKTLVSWKLNDGEWSEWMPASELKVIELNKLEKGEHVLRIRAKDDVGNISSYTHRFFVLEKAGVLGCSAAGAISGGGQSSVIMMIMILISALTPLVIRRKK